LFLFLEAIDEQTRKESIFEKRKLSIHHNLSEIGPTIIELILLTRTIIDVLFLK